jgi:hypothetical protein
MVEGRNAETRMKNKNTSIGNYTEGGFGWLNRFFFRIAKERMYKGVTGSTGYEVVEVMWRREERNVKFEVKTS